MRELRFRIKPAGRSVRSACTTAARRVSRKFSRLAVDITCTLARCGRMPGSPREKSYGYVEHRTARCEDCGKDPTSAELGQDRVSSGNGVRVDPVPQQQHRHPAIEHAVSFRDVSSAIARFGWSVENDAHETSMRFWARVYQRQQWNAPESSSRILIGYESVSTTAVSDRCSIELAGLGIWRSGTRNP